MSDIIKDLKELLGIDVTDTSKDNVLNIYIRRAVSLIRGYLNNDSFDSSYIQSNFQDAIVQMVYEGYSIKGDEAVKQKTQGSRSITYKDNLSMSINSVVDLLPAPFAKLR